MSKGTIHYGFGADYLPNWTIREALREIYQNFLDYGEYETVITETGDPLIVNVTVQNSWAPESLDYLRIGNSHKGKANPIGKHGEGLKMAFLILLRSGFTSSILTPKYEVWPEFYHDVEIGQCFCFKYEIHHEPIDTPYTLSFSIFKVDIESFLDSIIKESDVIFSDNYWGEIVNKPKGNIYSGGLFVATVTNLNKSYNINPAHMELDRDRSVPRAFDVNYAASKLNEAQGKFEANDTAYDDYSYVQDIPAEIKPTFKPRMIGNNVEFTYKDENNIDQVVKNRSVVEALKKDSFFEDAIKKLKKYIAKKVGLYDMLVEFKKKHTLYGEAAQDFDLILERVKNK